MPFNVLVELRKMNEVDKARLDERIETHMQQGLKRIKETDTSFKLLHN